MCIHTSVHMYMFVLRNANQLGGEMKVVVDDGAADEGKDEK